jgi:hypothetical protein
MTANSAQLQRTSYAVELCGKYQAKKKSCGKMQRTNVQRCLLIEIWRNCFAWNCCDGSKTCREMRVDVDRSLVSMDR